MARFHRSLPLLLTSLALQAACSPVDELGALDDERDLGALDDEDGKGNGLDGSDQLARPLAPATVVTVDARKSLLESNPDALGGFTMDGVFQTIIDTSGPYLGPGSEPTPVDVYNQIFDSFGDPSGTGTCTLGDYPLSCPRAEQELVDDMAGWYPIAAVNRFDLAPVDGSNCGEARLVFANRRESGIYGGAPQRAFMIFEAKLPNPHPADGRTGCSDIQWFWHDLADKSVSERNVDLLHAFLHATEDVDGFDAFLRYEHIKLGKIRTNTVFQEPWTLRELAMSRVDDTLYVDPVATPNSIYGPQWNGSAANPNAVQCQSSIVDAVDSLVGPDLFGLSVDSVDSQCFGAESMDTPDNDFAALLSSGTTDSTTLSGNIQAELTSLGSGLTPTDIAKRAQFAGSCIGCHETSNGVDLGGGLIAPSSLGFVHVSDVNKEWVDGEQCFEISDALESTFLPARQANMELFLDDTLPHSLPGDQVRIRHTQYDTYLRHDMTLADPSMAARSYWEVVPSEFGTQFKNRVTGKYLKAGPGSCYVGDITGIGDAASWNRVRVDGGIALKNYEHGTCCYVDSALDGDLVTGSCDSSLARVDIELAARPTGRTVTLEHTGHGTYLRDDGDGSISVDPTASDDSFRWETFDGEYGTQYRNLATGEFLKATSGMCYTGGITGTGTSASWSDGWTPGGVVLQDYWFGTCCQVDSSTDSSISMGACPGGFVEVDEGGSIDDAPSWLVSLVNIGGANHVIQVDIATGATHDACTVTKASTGGPLTGAIYSSTFTRDDRLLASKGSTLWEVSLPDCEATQLGSFGPYSTVYGISPDEADDLFGIDAITDTLLRIDSTTGAVTEVGTLSTNWHTLGVTWDDDAQQLLGLDGNTDTIYEIDMATAMTNLLHVLGTGFHQVAFEWHPRTGLAYACSNDTMLYRVEADGSLTALGVLGFGPGCLNLAAPWSHAAGLPPMP